MLLCQILETTYVCREKKHNPFDFDPQSIMTF